MLSRSRLLICALVLLSFSIFSSAAEDPLSRVLSLLKDAGVRSFSVLRGQKGTVVLIGEDHTIPHYAELKSTLVKEADQKKNFALFLEGHREASKSMRKILEVSEGAPVFGLENENSLLLGAVCLLLPAANLEKETGVRLVDVGDFEAFGSIMEMEIFVPRFQFILDAVANAEPEKHGRLLNFLRKMAAEEVSAEDQNAFAYSVMRATKRQNPSLATAVVKETAAQILKSPKLFSLRKEETEYFLALSEGKTFLHDPITLDYRNRVFLKAIAGRLMPIKEPLLTVVNVGERHRDGLSKLLAKELDLKILHRPIGPHISGLQSQAAQLRKKALYFENSRNPTLGAIFEKNARTIEDQIPALRKEEIVDSRYEN
jgi:hypothetical protein